MIPPSLKKQSYNIIVLVKYLRSICVAKAQPYLLKNKTQDTTTTDYSTVV